jgi:hypothetical protein
VEAAVNDHRAWLVVTGVGAFGLLALFLIVLVSGRRSGAIYRARVRKIGSGRIVCGYIGKTRQLPANRWRQHEDTQPWADLVVGWDVIREWKRISTFGLWWREIYYIWTRFPLYNYQWNLHNPRRVPKYTAVNQAMVRRPGWTYRQQPTMPYNPGLGGRQMRQARQESVGRWSR